jgi:hypothetical protein
MPIDRIIEGVRQGIGGGISRKGVGQRCAGKDIVSTPADGV